MKILFISKYCPSHFQNILLYFSVNPQNQIHFFSEYRHQELALKNVTYTNIRFPRVQYKGSKPEQTSIRLLRRSLAFSNALDRLKNTGFIPDIIITDTNHACSLNLPEIFPNIPTIGFCEWFFQSELSPQSDKKEGDEYSPEFLPFKINNMFQLETLRACTKLFTFSQCQKKSFPEFIQKKISVVPQGINTDFFAPKLEKNKIPSFLNGYEDSEIILLSYRNTKDEQTLSLTLDSLKLIFEKRKYTKLLLLSRTNTNPEEIQKIVGLAQQRLQEFSDRIIVHTNATIEEYKFALLRARVLLYPFSMLFANTSLFEAFSCATTVIAQQSSALEEFIVDGENAYFHAYDRPDSLAQLIEQVLIDPGLSKKLRTQARKQAVTSLSIKTELRKIVKTIEPFIQN